MKVDNSILQAGALAAISVLAGWAACAGQWQLVSGAVTGFFAVLNIHPREAGAPAPPTDPDPNV